MSPSLLAHTQRVTFELSNRCNMAPVHKRCPLHAATEPITLPARIVRRVISFLSEERFEGELAWHNYSEPLLDPRLFMLLADAKAMMPHVGLYILTNGFALTQTMLDELLVAGVTRIFVSTYSDSEDERIRALKWRGTTHIVKRFGRLDDRLTIYTRPECTSPGPCGEPLYNLLIRCTGDVCLCCNDWAATRTYGNLAETPLRDVLESGAMQADHARLSRGDRFLPICARCSCSRGVPK